MSVTFRKPKQKRIYQDLVDQIEIAILDGSLKPGEKLPSERELMEQFEISRNTLREALRVVEHKGLLEIKTGQKGGAIVKEISTEQITESLAFLIRYRRVALSHLTEFREGLEGNIAALAAERARTEDAQRLQTVLEQARNYIESDWETFVTLDKKLHMILAQMTGNPVYISVIQMVYDNIHNYYDRFFPKEPRLLWENFQDLYEIVRAVQEGRATEARELTKSHVRRFHGYMKENEEKEHVSSSAAPHAAAWSYEQAARPFAGQTLKMIGEDSPAWKALKKLKSEFEKLTGIKIVLEGAKLAEVDNRIAAGFEGRSEGWDAFTIGCFKVGNYAKRGWILEIDELFSRPGIQDPNFDPRRDTPPLIWRSSSEWQGRYYGITYEFIPPLFCYRKDLTDHPAEQKKFHQVYGYDIPVPPKTFLEFYDMVEFFTRRKGRKLAGVKLNHDFYGTILSPYLPENDDYYNLLLAMGGQLVTRAGKVETDSLVCVTALEFLFSLKIFSPPDLREYGFDEQIGALAAGSVFSHFSYPDFFSYLENPEKSKVVGRMGYFLPPDRGFINALSHTWCVSPFSTKKEAVWLWLQWVSSYDVQKRWHLLGGATPRLDVMHDPEVYKLPYIPVVIDSFDHLVEESKTPEAIEVHNIIVKEISKAADGELTPVQALRRAAKQHRELLNQ